jgi:hypothetical protein
MPVLDGSPVQTKVSGSVGTTMAEPSEDNCPEYAGFREEALFCDVDTLIVEYFEESPDIQSSLQDATSSECALSREERRSPESGNNINSEPALARRNAQIQDVNTDKNSNVSIGTQGRPHLRNSIPPTHTVGPSPLRYPLVLGLEEARFSIDTINNGQSDLLTGHCRLERPDPKIVARTGMEDEGTLRLAPLMATELQKADDKRGTYKLGVKESYTTTRNGGSSGTCYVNASHHQKNAILPFREKVLSVSQPTKGREAKSSDGNINQKQD